MILAILKARFASALDGCNFHSDENVSDYLDLIRPGDFVYKKVQKRCGEASFQYVTTGISLAMEQKLHAVITGPINKEAINLAGHHYSGHTEIFADYTDTRDYAMLLMSGNLARDAERLGNAHPGWWIEKTKIAAGSGF